MGSMRWSVGKSRRLELEKGPERHMGVRLRVLCMCVKMDTGDDLADGGKRREVIGSENSLFAFFFRETWDRNRFQLSIPFGKTGTPGTFSRVCIINKHT